ncbi:hypothetical protein CVT24_006772 [Panaeolus cyanescens]|uniref:F-box domain-containing protein n=1 Tax=Panaeolus cyanescens TaxID=181874 RepID=A0A409V9F7_9AGAR|nr:hypothetical protein CVT24_006772 [Panaeolus cyanescens]
MVKFMTLPPELILSIYKEVTPQERKHLRLLCSYFNNILKEEILSCLRIDIHAPLFLLRCDISAFQNLVRRNNARRSLSVVMIKPANGLLVKAPTLPRIDETTLDLLSKILGSVTELRSFSWTLHYGASRNGMPLLVDWLKQIKGLREFNVHLMDHVPSLGLALHASSISTLTKLRVLSTGSKSLFNEGTFIDDISAIIADAPQLREIRAIQDNSVDIFANVVHNSSRTSDAAVLFSRARRDRSSALTSLVLEGLAIRCLTPNVLFYIRSLCHFSYLPPDKPSLGSTYGYAREEQQDFYGPLWTTLNKEKIYHLQTLQTTALHSTLWPYLAKLSHLKRLSLTPPRPAQERQDETLLENFREVALPALAPHLEELVITAHLGSSCWCFDDGLGEVLKAHPLPKLKYLEVSLSAPGDGGWARPSVVQIYSSRGPPEWQPNAIFEKVHKLNETWKKAGCDKDNIWVCHTLISSSRGKVDADGDLFTDLVH